MANRYLTAIFIIVIYIGMVLTPYAKAGQQSSPEYQIKVAFLYNFAKFVEWPEGTFTDPETPLTICILGKDPFGGALKTIANKTVRGRRLVIHQSESVSSVEGCHILFVTESEKNRVRYIIDNLKGRSVLTMSDMDDFVEAGGIIGIVQVKNKIRFHINLGSAHDCGLTISSKLLKLARKVVR